MKKVSLFLIATLFLSVFLNSCNFLKDGYIEVWSRCQEFDGVGFDLDQYLADLQKDDTVQIEDVKLWDEIERAYRITYSDQSVLLFSVFKNSVTAESDHQNLANQQLRVQSLTPLWTAIRVDNVIVIPKTDLLSNKRLIDFARSIGIESNQIVLNKVNEAFHISQKKANNSLEDILETMEGKGFSLIEEASYVSENYGVYTFVSADNFAVYELYITCGNQAKNDLFQRIDLYIKDSPNKNHAHVYYSIGDDFCMYFMGTSADTRDLWDEIRK